MLVETETMHYIHSVYIFPIDIGQLRLEIGAAEELSRQLFLEVHALRNMQERQRWALTLQGKYFNVLGHFFSLYCLWKIFICTINIIFDRVGKKDPVTRGIEIAVHWCGLEMDVAFWSQHVSFFLVGCIVVTSIRGLLLTLTKVYWIFNFIYWHASTTHSFSFKFRFSSSTKYHRVNRPTLLCWSWHKLWACTFVHPCYWCAWICRPNIV